MTWRSTPCDHAGQLLGDSGTEGMGLSVPLRPLPPLTASDGLEVAVMGAAQE